MPISIVTKPGFIALINSMDKRYRIASRTSFSQVAIPELYKKMQTEICSRAENNGVLCDND